MKVPTSPSVPPPEARAVVRDRPCWLCQTGGGKPCTERGDHLARWLSAYSDHAISRADLRDVVVRLVVVTRWCVVDEDTTPERAA